jgi:acetylornithine/N-succinyldiaminopimelate aminotransferase
VIWHAHARRGSVRQMTNDRRWPTYATRDIVLDTAASDRDPEGRGSLWVRDTEGREFLDAVGGIGCLPLGHAHPKWVAAVSAQAGKLAAAAASFVTAPQQALVRELVARVPIPDARVFLGNTGTEVNEAAIKLALRATRRDIIVAFSGAFHGRTLGSIALTATPAYRDPYVSCFGEKEDRFARVNVTRVPWNDLDAVRAMFAELGPRIAAVFVEPVQGEGGIHPAPRSFLVALRELCDTHGALLGVDEIQCGTGRTGNFAAWTTIVGDDPQLFPDIAWFAKALGGGFPIGACVAKAELAEHMSKGTHGSTFGGNPLACAAAVATLQIMDDEDLLASAAAQLPTLRRIIAEDPEPRIAQVRGLGAMIGIEITGEGEPAAPLGDLLQAQGLLVTICKGTTVRLLLPYRADETVLRTIWTKLRKAIAQLPA